jgi:glycine/D-amino acid oxidase-like deaminating enzyme
VVIGAGAFGGWTALYLREMGLSVTLVDQYGPGNAYSSSGGEMRQIRAAYGDREIYTRWVIEAFKRWKAREEEWGRQMFFQTGQLTLATRWTQELRNTKRVFDELGVDYEVIQPDELVRRYPQFNHQGVEFGFYVPSTGLLRCREGCLAVSDALQKKGGRFVMARAEPGRRSGGRLQDVRLSTGEALAAQTFVFACGPWFPKLFPDVLKDKLMLARRPQIYIGTPPDDNRFSYPNCPNFNTQGAYGFPSIEGKGLKIGPFWGAPPMDPDTEDRVVTAEEIRKTHEFTASAFTALAGQPIVETRVAPRASTVDGHFVVDRHPELENVWLLGGGSGHGYKHGIMVGDYAAKRVVGNEGDPQLAAMFRIKDETF